MPVVPLAWASSSLLESASDESLELLLLSYLATAIAAGALEASTGVATGAVCTVDELTVDSATKYHVAQTSL